MCLGLLAVERVPGADGHREHQPRAARELLARDACGRKRVVDAVREREAGGSHVERGELVGPEADDRDTERLEAFEREREIEDELRAGAHDAHGMPCDGLEIRGLVERSLAAAVHPTDAACREDADARTRRDLNGRRDRGRAERATREHRRDVAQAHLRDVLLVREAREERLVGADHRRPRGERDRRRDRTGAAHLVLHAARGLEVERLRQSVRDDRRL